MNRAIVLVIKLLKGENCSIPPQDERKRPHTGYKQPKTIPKPIHNILLGSQGGEVSKNAYLDTIKSLSPKALVVKGLKEWGRRG
jgi:hypothetical protein